MQNKVVYVLLDGLQGSYAKEHLGYLEHLCEKQKAAKYEVLGELPSSSRPMYETIFTGVPVYEHGITNNSICRLSDQQHLFQMLKETGRRSLALAYYWISELYLSAPFDPMKDVWHVDEASAIQKGFFYYEDQFPDNHLYSLASALMCREDYDFVFIHPMNIDDAGHRFGAGSRQYGDAVMQNDKLLSTYLPQWIKAGYRVVVGADHGMSTGGYHGGNSEEQRKTALYIVDETAVPGFHSEMLTTLDVAPLLCHMLGLRPSAKMKTLGVAFYDEG